MGKPESCNQSELICAYAVEALDQDESALATAHVAACAECGRELASLGLLIERFVFWPTDVLRPPGMLQARLDTRIGGETGRPPGPRLARQWPEPEWNDPAPGISCKVLARDDKHERVSMLVRLAPGARYPAHTHAGEEELHLLAGELWVDGRKLCPGDYNLGLKGTSDAQVWSETGCTCVLVTSSQDILS